MIKPLNYAVVHGVKSYSPEMMDSYNDYPDNGFEFMETLENNNFWWVRSRSRVLKNIIRTLSSNFPQAQFLEVGCGTGTLLQEIGDIPNLSITGSEIYLKGLLFAKKKLPNMEFIQYDVTKGILPEQFDIIGSFDVLEHIEDDTTAIANIYAMTRSGGYFVVTVPQYMFLWSDLDNSVNHKRRYSKKELVNKLKKEGFTIDFSSSFVFILFPLMLVSRLFDSLFEKKDISQKSLEKRVHIPKTLDMLFDVIMRIDEFLIKKRITLPFGGTLLVIAKKL